ncbi:MAG: hypothetical protein Q4D29_08420 [Lachnospiraceae bacterium]|nr:hypothetical protein [Lachnospiraceae bacterium]
MPRDKKLSHQRVLEAAKKEFLEKGFEGASIRTIGSSVVSEFSTTSYDEYDIFTDSNISRIPTIE